MIEPNVMNALVAAGEALILASLVYFFYLVLKFADLPHVAGHEGERRLHRGGSANIALWLGEPEHGRPARGPGNAAASLNPGVPLRFRDSA